MQDLGSASGNEQMPIERRYARQILQVLGEQSAWLIDLDATYPLIVEVREPVIWDPHRHPQYLAIGRLAGHRHQKVIRIQPESSWVFVDEALNRVRGEGWFRGAREVTDSDESVVAFTWRSTPAAWEGPPVMDSHQLSEADLRPFFTHWS